MDYKWGPGKKPVSNGVDELAVGINKINSLMVRSGRWYTNIQCYPAVGAVLCDTAVWSGSGTLFTVDAISSHFMSPLRCGLGVGWRDFGLE